MSDSELPVVKIRALQTTNVSRKIQSSSDPFQARAYDRKNGAAADVVEKALKNAKGDVESKQIEEILTDMTMYSALEVAEPVYNLQNLADLYDINVFHAAACDAKVDSVVGLGYKYEYSSKVLKQLEKIEKKADGPEKKRKLELRLDNARDEFIDFINSMNFRDSLQEIMFRVYLDRCIMGNGYIEVGRNKLGKIAYIGHLNPIHVRVRKARDGYIQMVNGKTVFFRNFGDRKTPDPTGKDPRPHELIHIARYSPKDPFYGVPEITAAIPAIAGIRFAEQYNIDYFENKAVPRYIIKTRGVSLGEGSQMELLKFFESNLKGESHRTLFVPIPGGDQNDIEFVPVEAGKQDGHFLNYIKDITQMIMSRHRVPQARIGLSASATSQAESREAEKTFKETVCQPEQRKIEEQFNKVVKELTDLFVFRLQEYSLTDEDTQSQIYERYLRWGVLVSDEVRIKLGLGPRSDGHGSDSQDMLSITRETAKNQLELQAQAAKQQMDLAKQQAKVAATTQAAQPASPAAKKAAPAKKVAQGKADAKADQYGTRTRDQNRNADNPRKNPNNRNGQRPGGEGKHPNK